jgi:membrane protease YdiL (CAAX protease family)
MQAPNGTHCRSNLSDTVEPVSFAATAIPGSTTADITNALDQLARIRELMGHFFINMIVILCGYTVVVECTANLSYDLNTSIFIAVCLLLALLLPAILVVTKRSPLSLKFYGVTWAEWPAAVRDAVIYSLPILALTVLAKAIAIQIVPRCYHLDLFSGRLSQYPINKIHLLQMAVYVGLIPVQEFVARGVLQGSLQEFLTGRHVVLKSICISNLIFSTFHIYVSPYYAVVAFLPGLFWGWLYSRHRTLVGVCVSHMLVGVWTLYFLGLSASPSCSPFTSH